METTTAEGGNNLLLNPIMQESTIVWRLRNITWNTDHTELHTFRQDGKCSKTPQTETLNQLWSTAHSIGEKRLGFCAWEVGNKSMRTSTTMTWCLSTLSVFHAMMMGRWKSLAFLTYSRPQVLEFWKGMLKSLLQHKFQAITTPALDSHVVDNSVAPFNLFLSYPSFNIPN